MAGETATTRVAAAVVAAAAAAAENDGSTPLVVRGHQLPLQFDGIEDEVNFLGVLSALDFGSGFARELEQAGQEGAPQRPFEEVVLFGVMHMYISGAAIDADGLRAVSAFGIEQHFGISSTVEEEALGGAIRASVPGPLKPLVDLMVKTLNSLGAKLVDLGSKSLGHFLVEKCREEGPDLDAAAAVQLLADTFGSVFEDRIPAQVAADAGAEGSLLLGRKAVRFLERVDDRFFEETAPGEQAESLRYLLKDIAAKLPVKVDAELISGMHALGLVFATDETEDPLEGTVVLDVSSPEDAAREQRVRAQAWMHAKALLAEPSIGEERITARQLDAFLRRSAEGHADGESETEEKEGKTEASKLELIVRGTNHY
ncbi:Hypothetical Protein FCC1311_052202 [Hondaea fermentalgiana]|uniref:Queuosine 5'-phosphate N-glycosylase/hydrolase n=1 Tax=Hondaea fermentalgiana TaxID=2315210 RepID=A0A2R5GFA0_9STRA|nr:Hypothetical Protein FCC1311_052202 [Hondaea fermentalgiana]|eukprot:GBG28999.1 Hypothetical Protein FCC1311_052202 [Hondaea fermentalgiana]